MSENSFQQKNRPFNTSLESGLRSLFILDAIAPNFRDLQRLIYYDYLIVHSSDVPDGPTSLHPAIPHRSGEWLVRRELVQEGLNLMFSKELIIKNFNPGGISYSASELTSPFLKYFTSTYSTKLKERATWIRARFEKQSDDELKIFMSLHLGRWGAEFKHESIIRGVLL